MDAVIEAVLGLVEAALPKRLHWTVLILWIICIVGIIVFYFYGTWEPWFDWLKGYSLLGALH